MTVKGLLFESKRLNKSIRKRLKTLTISMWEICHEFIWSELLVAF